MATTKLYFKCTFLADVILNATSATAGATETLSYIPGAKFLGIVAKKAFYNSLGNNALTVFHNGKVRFGDAHLADKTRQKRSTKAPFAFFKAKTAAANEEGKIWVKCLMSEKEDDDLRKEGKQLKQERDSFFIKNEQGENIKQSVRTAYSLKSAYNADERRTQNQQMFGYNAISKGSVWLFSVEIDEEAKQYEESIKKALEGKHCIGKSRTAQYGQVCIKELTEAAIEPQVNVKNKEGINNIVLLYAESDWCFVDAETGEYTVTPTAAQLGIEEGKICWRKSQLRHRVYAPWNLTRAARDADRWVIEKGSVLVIKTTENVSQSQFEKGIGSFRSEGLGKVLVNPEFLASNEFWFTKPEEKPKETANSKEITEGLTDKKLLAIAHLLQNRKKAADPQNELAKKVAEFANAHKDKFKNITASQWGQVRVMAQNSKQYFYEMLFNDKMGFLETAKRKDVWKSDMLSALKVSMNNFLTVEDKRNFLIALASEMAKIRDYSK